MQSNISLLDYHHDTYQFWHETIATIQALTLRKGYSFAPEIVCINKDKFNYKIAFFVSLALGVLLLILLCLACFIQLTIRKEVTKEKMGEMNSGGIKT